MKFSAVGAGRLTGGGSIIFLDFVVCAHIRRSCILSRILKFSFEVCANMNDALDSYMCSSKNVEACAEIDYDLDCYMCSSKHVLDLTCCSAARPAA